MRILLVHNYYGSESPSGENRAFDSERELLESRGHDVLVFSRHSDEIRASGVVGLVRGGLATPWNFATIRDVTRLAERFRPEIVHVHNTFPLISPSVFYAKLGAARVQTLHNFRIFCAAGIPMRNGIVCMECLIKRNSLAALRHACYRRSRLATFPIAAGIELHRSLGTWSRAVEATIALTEYHRREMVAAGLPENQVWVKPNFYSGEVTPDSWSSRDRRVVYVGRLSEEKGIRCLIDAWISWGRESPELLVVGDGPLREEMERAVRNANSTRITFVGQVESKDAQQYIARSKLLVVPSTCIEGFPLVVAEALALGTPTLVSDLGALPSLVSGAGATFRSGDKEHLVEQARLLTSDERRLSEMGSAARRRYEDHYSKGAVYETQMRVYAAAIASKRRGMIPP